MMEKHLINSKGFLSMCGQIAVKILFRHQNHKLVQMFDKLKLGKLYHHIPKKVKTKILLRTRNFDRIGPIKIPTEINSTVVELTLYYYICFESKNEYFLITKNRDLKFSNPFLRISSNCFYAYVINSKRCDCQWQLNHSLSLLQ